MYPVGNATGAWMFLSLTTTNYLQQSHWVKTITTEIVVRAIDTIADQEVAVEFSQEFEPDEEEDLPEEEPGVPDLEDQVDADSDDEDDDPPEEQPHAIRHSARIEAGVNPSERLTLVNIKVKESEWGKQEDTG